MTAYDFDLFVIGAGSGGVRAARIAAGHGARVAIAEESRVGGTCVIRGCVPKKLLVYASRFADDFEDAAGFGWTVPERTFSWSRLIAAKDREIARLEGLYRSGLERAGVTVFAARAAFQDRHTLRLGPDGRTVTADTVLIATGSRPDFGEPIPGIEHALASDAMFGLPELPQDIVIYGGGYIALEFAGIFSGLGVETTIVYRGDRILRGFDDDLRDGLTEAYTRRGIRLVTENRIVSLERTGGRVTAHLDGGAVLEASHVLFATGRRPNTAGLGLDSAGVAQGWDGRVAVDAASRTSVDNIYAVGDVTNRLNLTPAAIREGHAFADTLFGGRPWSADHSLVPTAVFSTPEVGTVGLPEHLAREHHGEVVVYKSRFRPLKAALSGRDERMLVKLIAEAAGGRVIGCHVLGPDAAEIVQMAAIAMNMGATKADFDRTMALHPTAAEELVTLRTSWTPPAASESPAGLAAAPPAARA